MALAKLVNVVKYPLSIVARSNDIFVGIVALLSIVNKGYNEKRRIMRIIMWLGKHKIWAYFAVTFFIAMILSGVFGFNPLGLGRIIGLLFIPYLFVIWSYSKAKKGKEVKG